MKRLSEEMDVDKVYFNKLSEEEVEKSSDEIKKEAEKDLKDGVEVAAEVNNPKGVETPKEVEVKVLKEQLILSEELDEDEYFDLVSELFQAMQKVCKKWAKYSAVDYEDFERAISEASERLIEIEPELWESLKNNSVEEAYYSDRPIKEIAGEVRGSLKSFIDSLVKKYGAKVMRSGTIQGIFRDEPLKILYKLQDVKVDESCDDETPLEEDFKVISTLNNFKPWSGAVDTWNTIKDAGMLDSLDSLLEEIYPEGLDETELNDLLWFEPEWILDSLGLGDGSEDEE